MTASLAVMGVVLALICYLAARVGGGLAADEVKGWLPYLGRALIRAAVRRLPPELQDGEANWHAELYDKRDRPLTMLAFAFGVRRKAQALGAVLGQQGQADEQELEPEIVSDITEINEQYEVGLITENERKQAVFYKARGLSLRRRVDVAMQGSSDAEKGFLRTLHECVPYSDMRIRARRRIRQSRYKRTNSGDPRQSG